MNHPLWRVFVDAFISGVRARMPNRNARIEDARAWIKRHLIPTKQSTMSCYSAKHYFERFGTPCHIGTGEFAEVCKLEGFTVEPTEDGGRIRARLSKEARNK
jgi:hypothetical protein